MKTIDYKDSKISYFDSGKKNITLLFVHGSFSNKEYWTDQVKFFSPDYRVVTLDLPGNGKSPKGNDAMTAKNYGDALTFFIKELNLKNVILIGHSAGADAILEEAIQNPEPVIGFVAVDYFKNVGVPLPQEIIDQTTQGLKKDFPATVEMYVRKGLVSQATDSAITKKIVNAYRNTEPEAGTEAIIDGLTYTDREKDLIGKLGFKIYMINVDYKPTNEDALKGIATKGYELITIQGTSHYPMIENPIAFNHALEKAIAEIEPNQQ